MAINNTEKDFAFMEFPMAFTRQDSFPLDKTSQYGSYAEAQPNTIYYVLQNNGGIGNQYIEYMLINGALEAIGYGYADLSGYVTEDYVAKADDALIEDIFNQLSPIQEKYVGTGNLVAFWGLTKDLLDEMEAVQNDLASDIELLELCVTNRPVEGNPFVVTFETLNNLDVEGVWETANKRISF